MLSRTRTAGLAGAVLAALVAPAAGAGAPTGTGTGAVATEPVSAPPGVRLAYVTGTARSLPAVWVARGNGREPSRLGPGSDPLVSPNGQLVAASLLGATPQLEQGPALALYSTKGAPARDYLDLASASAVPLAWSRDSKYLAVSVLSGALTGTARRSSLAVIDTGSGALATIAHGQVYGASFAPDRSDAIAYAVAPTQSQAAPVNVYVSRPDGSGRRALSADGRSLYPLWGARGIAYDRERLRGDFAPAYQIWLRPSGGGRARRLTHVRAGRLVSGLVPIAFSADGRRLLAEFEGQDTSEAWTVLVRSGRARRLRVRGRTVIGAGLSRNGRSVLIDEAALGEPPSHGRVASVRFDGRRRRVLVAHGSQGSWNR